MIIDPQVAADVESIVGSILSSTRVGGGCISNACRVETVGAQYFLKWSDGEPGSTFEAEGIGLKTMREASHRLKIPEVLSAVNADHGRPGHILLEWIEEGSRSGSLWSDLGIGLAEMHRNQSDLFGFETDNFIGRLPQTNRRSQSWPEFFLTNRLSYQRDVARDLGRWQSSWDPHFESLERRLADILPDNERPSLVHGDLWGGNVLADASNVPVLIDPAVHYAHREVDLAMSELFGGFARTFYESYRQAWPVEPGYETRRDVYNLYHLINHLNHFGSSYAGQVRSILQRY